MACGSATRTVLDSTGSFVDFGLAPAIDARGQIAFIVGLADGRSGVYRADPIRRRPDDRR